MKFDPRRASKRPPKNRDPNKPWDLRTYKVRTKDFTIDLRGKEITKEVLKIFGEEMVKGVREAAKRAAGMGTGIPRSKRFLDSFYYVITEDGSIKIMSEWQWVKKYLERKEPYDMNWLTRSNPNKPKAVPIRTKSGEVVFRNLPLRTDKKWIHPSVFRFNFVEQGVQKGKMKALRRATFFITKQMKGEE